MVICLLSGGCISDTPNNNDSTDNTNTNVITNTANQPSYPFFTPWWNK